MVFGWLATVTAHRPAEDFTNVPTKDGPRCAESRFAKLTHRSELEQVGVHRDVVGDFDSVPHDPGDQEHPSLLERDHHERKKKGRIYFPPASTAQFEQRAKK